jgi:4,5-DOPA dioxygenase extradiol
MDWKLVNDGYAWAQRFDEEVKQTMLTEPAEFARLDAHRDFATAVPTPDHFIPALYLAGLVGASAAPDT